MQRASLPGLDRVHESKVFARTLAELPSEEPYSAADSEISGAVSETTGQTLIDGSMDSETQEFTTQGKSPEAIAAFIDVPASNPFYAQINIIRDRQVTLGCTPDHMQYCPNDPVTREQMSAFILRSLGEFNPPTPASPRFGDVPSSNAFYNFIDRIAVLGITVGCVPNGTPPLYCPGSPVTRGQMVTGNFDEQHL